MAKPAKKRSKIARKTTAHRDAQPEVFQLLRSILEKHARGLVVTKDDDTEYHLDTKTIMPNEKPLYFGGVRAGRAYTSFYLMPVYMSPELLGGISDALRARMQGKSCFNFKHAERPLLDELRVLTGRAYARWKKEGKI